ncbi:MAG: polymer-forming cytoskeletal protein [Clostridiaceae bacterium]|nr:polymer-forming cytoskeletal protein [Clostridiaceae bacterium]
MLKSKTAGASMSRSFDSLIGEKTVFEGSINCDGAIRIDGKVTGDIKASGDIVVGEGARMEGNLSGNIIQISGIVNGNVYSNYMVRLCSTARLNGDIETVCFITEEGAFFHGKCTMISQKDNTGNHEKD